MSSKHDKYVRRIDAIHANNRGGAVVLSVGGATGGGGGASSQGPVAATDVFFAPAGNVQADNVQTAIEELDDEKLPLTGGTMTGVLILSDMLPDVDHEAASKWYVDHLDHLLVPDAAGVPIARLTGGFVRIGHPLQPGLTWTMAEGVRLPAVCITELLDRFTTFIAVPAGTAGPMPGAIHYIPAATRLSTVAVALTENNLATDVTMLLVAADTVAGLNGAVDAAVAGMIEIPIADLEVVGAAEDFVIDVDTGEFVTSGVNFVVSGDDPLLPAGSWLAVWDGTSMDFLAGVTVTIFGTRV